MRVTRSAARGVAVLVAAVAVAGCLGGATRTETTAPALATAMTSSPAALSPAPTAGEAAEPPGATLGVEGGERVPGQLGSYTWRDAGSDSPWLPGAPIPVGAGEALAMAFIPPIEPISWRARYAPAGQADATGARPLGDGTTATTSFPAPPAGRWTLALEATFDVGSATYYWAVEVR